MSIPTVEAALAEVVQEARLAGMSNEHLAEAFAVAAIKTQTPALGPSGAAIWLAQVGQQAAGFGAMADADAALADFNQTAYSSRAKRKILDALQELLDADVEPKLVSDALMGAALHFIQDRRAVVGLHAYLVTTADQIKEALERPTTAPM